MNDLKVTSMQEDPKYIFVLGGAGYIGSHVSKALACGGYTPVVIDNLVEGFLENSRYGPFHELDISLTDALKDLFRRYNPLACLHLAAFLSVGESVKNPLKYYKNNVAGTLSLLEAMLQTRKIPLVFSSSAAVYGTAQEDLISENHSLNPLNPYGHTKQIVEQILADYKQAYGLRSVSLRYFNAAGADPGLELGPRRAKPFHLIPLMVKSIVTGQAKLEIYGNDYPTADGTCIRDYIHVSDLANAHVKALEKLLNQEELPLAMNLGTGRGYSVLEVHRMMEKVSGQKIKVTILPRRAGDGAVLVANSSLAKEKLSWKPLYSDLETICQTEWNWSCYFPQ